MIRTDLIVDYIWEQIYWIVNVALKSSGREMVEYDGIDSST